MLTGVELLANNCSQKGMQQQYDLGEYLRSRYTNSSSEMYLFNGTYVREEVDSYALNGVLLLYAVRESLGVREKH